MAIYYVSESGGSDTPSRDGDLFNPWRTITYAIGRATTGDTIQVRGGTYAERVVVNKANMTVKAYGGETVTIYGKWEQDLSAKVWPIIDYSKHPVTGQDDGMIQLSADGVTIDGLNVSKSAARGIVVTGDNCTLKNLSIVRTLGTGILLYQVNGGTVQDVKIMLASQNMKYFIDGVLGNWPHSLAPRSSRNTIWRRVEVYESEGEGFSSITGYGALIESCKAVNMSKPPLYMVVSPGAVVRNCEFYCTHDYAGPRYSNNGLSVINGLKFAEEDGEIRKAIDGLTRDVEIYNNVFINVQKGLVIGQGISSAGVPKNGANAVNCLIANNTFYEPSGGKVLLLQNVTQTGRTISGNVIENNIFHGPITDTTTAGNQVRSGITWRHNYWSQTPSAWMQHAGDTTGTIGFVSASTPSTTSEFDPDNHDNFDPTDYHLTASSPAVDAGLSNAVTTDYLGNARGASPDQGFHEYDGTEPDPTVTLTAGFTMSANRVEESTAVTLTDTSTISSGSIDAWSWQYKLASATSWTSHSTSATPADLTIATAGEYQVRLTVTDTETSQSSASVLTLTVTEAGEDDVTTCTGNLLSNSDFASGTTDWSFNAGTGGSGSWSAASGYADVTVTTASSNMQLYQAGATITEGTQYRLAFRAKGGQTRTLRAFLFDNTSIQNLGVQAQDFSITTNWLAYEYIFTATNSSSNARLQFRVGLTTGSVQIDDLCLAPYTAPSAPESIITVPSNPASLNVEQTLDGTGSTGSPTAYSWSIDGEEAGTSSTYAWTPTSPRPHTIALTVTNAYGSDTSTQSVNVTIPGSGGGTSAALLYGTVPGSTGSDGGTDHADVGTTGGVLLATSGASTLGTAADDARIGIGGTDGTNHRAVSAHADHGVGTTLTRSKSDQATAYLITPTSTVVVDGDAALTDADTTTITYNTVSSGLQYAGLRITADNAAVGDFVPGGTAVNVGFQPDVVFAWGSEGTTDFAGSNDIGLFVTFGFATAEGQRSIAMRSTNDAAATAASAAYSHSYAGMVLTGSAIADGVAVTITATGFSHTTTGSMAGKMAYMALKLPTGSALEIVDLDTKTTTGTQSHSVSIEATAAVALGTLANVVDSVEFSDDASAFSVGFWDGTTHRAVAITDDDAATTTVSKSHASAALLHVPSADGSDNISATVDSVTHSTFVLNYAGVDSTARKSSILLIEGVATGLDDIDYLQPGIQTGTVPGMP